jgi:hypothetical protein
LRKEHRLRVFENRVLRKIFGPKREEDGSWRTLDNDELHSLYSSPNIVRVIKMEDEGHAAGMGDGRGIYRVLVERPEGKSSLGKPRHRREDNIKMNLWEIRNDAVNWIQPDQDRVQWQGFVNTVMNLRFRKREQVIV